MQRGPRRAPRRAGLVGVVDTEESRETRTGEGAGRLEVEQLPTLCFAENGVVEIESEWTARDRELKMFGGPARIFLSPEPALSLSKG